MKNVKILIASLALAFSAGAAQAVILDTTSAANVIPAGNPGEGAPGPIGGDGQLQNFTGIDWHANGAAFVQGFDLTGANTTGQFDDFTLTYQAFATNIFSTSAIPDLRIGAPGSGVGTYELTTLMTLHERATCVNVGCTIISLTFTPSTTSIFDIYFDTTPDAVQATGTGFGADPGSVLIISGVWGSQFSNFAASAPVPTGFGAGSAILNGTVTTTNGAYVSPALSGSRFDSTLNFPGQTLVFTRPTFVNGMATNLDTATDFVLQADGSQQFTVPEPTTVALLGLGLLGFAASRRKTGKSNNA